MTHLRVDDPDPIEEPVWKDEEQHQHAKQRSEDKDPWQTGLGRPKEECPDGQQQDEQLEGYRDEEALAGRAAALQLVWPQQVWDDQEGQWRQEDQQAQHHGQAQGQVTPAVEAHAVLQVFGDAANVLLREAVLWRAGDGCRGLPPVVILHRQKEKHTDILSILAFSFNTINSNAKVNNDVWEVSIRHDRKCASILVLWNKFG